MGSSVTRMELLKRIKGMRISVVDQAMFSACNAITLILVAKGLGPQVFGDYIFVWTMVQTVIALQGAFLISPMTVIGPKQDILTAHQYYGSVFLVQLATSALLFVLVWLVLGLQPNVIFRHMALPMAAATSLYACQDFIRRYFFAVNNTFKVFMTDLIGSVLQLAILLGCFWFHIFNTSLVLWTIAGTSLAAMVWGICNADRLLSRHCPIVPSIKRNWHFGSWTLLSMVSTTVGTQLEIIMMKLFLGAAVFGGVRAIINLGNLLFPLIQGIQNVVVPKASRIFTESAEDGLVAYLFQVGSVVTLLIFLILLAVGFFREQLVTLVYGKSYALYANLMLLQALCSLINVIRIFFWIYLQTIEHVKFIFLTSIVTNIVYIGLLFLCLKQFHAQGAFFAAVIIAALLLLSCSVYVLRIHAQYQFQKSLVKS